MKLLTGLLMGTLLLLAAGCNQANVYERHYRVYGSLHPELQAQHRQDCRSYGYREGSKEFADCMLQMAQDWKRNYEWRPNSNIKNSQECGYSILGFPMTCTQKR